MKPATREGALDLVAEIIHRGLQRREQRSARPANDTNTNNGAGPEPDAAATRSTTTRPDQEQKDRRA